MFFRVKEIIIVLLIEDITITSKKVFYLEFNTFSSNLLKIIYSLIRNNLLFYYILIIIYLITIFFLAI